MLIFYWIEKRKQRRTKHKVSVDSPFTADCQHKLLKVGLSPFKRNCFICFNENLLKMTENAFYFILKKHFHSQDIFIFVLAFWSCRKSDLGAVHMEVVSWPG